MMNGSWEKNTFSQVALVAVRHVGIAEIRRMINKINLRRDHVLFLFNIDPIYYSSIIISACIGELLFLIL